MWDRRQFQYKFFGVYRKVIFLSMIKRGFVFLFAFFFQFQVNQKKTNVHGVLLRFSLSIFMHMKKGSMLAQVFNGNRSVQQKP